MPDDTLPQLGEVYVVLLDEFSYGEPYARVMGAFSAEDRAQAFIDGYVGIWDKGSMSVEHMVIDQPPKDY